jgi:peroxiredoxin
MQQMFFIADLIDCSTCFGHYYAHHQELQSSIQLVVACCLWCLVFKLSVWCGAEAAANCTILSVYFVSFIYNMWK